VTAPQSSQQSCARLRLDSTLQHPTTLAYLLVAASPPSDYPGSLASLLPAVCCLSALQSTGKNTFFGKTATMLQSADGLGHLQRILMSIVIALVVISLVLCITMLIYLMVYGKESLKEALTFVVVVLVVSIPIAIEIVCTTTLAIGSRQVGVCLWVGCVLVVEIA
jgi:hypothetical protein